MSGSHLSISPIKQQQGAWESTRARDPFSTEEFALISSGYELQTGRPAWVGYGFTAPGTNDLARVFLFSEDSPGDRFILTQPSPGFYEVLAPDGDLLWSGSGLDNLLGIFAPKTLNSSP